MAFNDSNTGSINAVDMLDANLALTTYDDKLTFSLYAKNLLDEAWSGGDSPLPFPAPGSTFSPLNKGRVTGLEMQLHF